MNREIKHIKLQLSNRHGECDESGLQRKEINQDNIEQQQKNAGTVTSNGRDALPVGQNNNNQQITDVITLISTTMEILKCFEK